MLDLIGWSTAPDDVPVFGQRLDQLLDVVFLAPWWLPWGFAFFATGLLMFVSWPREKSFVGNPPAQTPDQLPIPTLKSEGLYVGVTTVDAQNVEDTLEITIRMLCFNGTGETIFAQSVNGHVLATETVDGKEIPLGELPPAWLSEKYKTDSFPAYREFTVALQQRVPKTIANSIKILGTRGMSLNLEEVNVIIASEERPNETARLPVWDGIKISRNPNMLHSGRNLVLHVGSSNLRLS